MQWASTAISDCKGVAFKTDPWIERKLPMVTSAPQRLRALIEQIDTLLLMVGINHHRVVLISPHDRSARRRSAPCSWGLLRHSSAVRAWSSTHLPAPSDKSRAAAAGSAVSWFQNAIAFGLLSSGVVGRAMKRPCLSRAAGPPCGGISSLGQLETAVLQNHRLLPCGCSVIRHVLLAAIGERHDGSSKQAQVPVPWPESNCASPKVR